MSIIEEQENKKMESNNAKKMKNAAKDTGRKIMKKLAGQILIVVGQILMKLLPLIIVVTIILGILNMFLQWLTEIFQGENTATAIYEALEVEDLSDLVEIKGNETDGYYLEFVSDIDTRLDTVIEALQENSDAKDITDKSLLKKMIKAEVVSQFPNLGGTVDEENENQFQGTVNIRRVTPNKEIGQLKNTGTGSAIKSNVSVQASGDGLGTKQDIPEDVKNQMKGHSMPDGASTTYDQLSYLTIPYYDFDGNVQQGNMIVKKELADEILLIFQELYNDGYPIYKMQLIDNYQGTGEDLDWNSIEDNNTSAFCFRNSTGGSIVSKHGLGQAIDINPLINPYVTAEGSSSSHSVSNDCGYIYRDLSKWKDNTSKWSLETAKKANIDTNTKIYEIFKKYGWTWGGDWNSPKDYQHFEKTDLSSVVTISGNANTSSNQGEDNEGETVGDGQEYVVAIAAGHNNTNNTGASSGNLREEQLTIKVAEAVEQMFSIYSNIKVVQTGSTSADPGSVQKSDRVRLAQEANADICIQIHFNASGGDYCMTYYKKGDTHSQALGEILSASIAQAVGIEDKGAQSDQSGWSNGSSLSIIGHYDNTGFPNIVTEGMFIDNPQHAQMIESGEGIKKYAEGIVDGVLEYFELENNGYGQTSDTSTSGGGGVNSKIFNLKYIEPTTFDDLVANHDMEAINVFTLDEDKNLVTAKWSYTTEEGTKISKNSSMNYRVQLNKFSMPLEYLIAWLIDVKDEDFVSQFADLAIDSEYVIAVQDNITTVETVKTRSTKVKTVTQEKTTTYSGSTSWTKISENTGDWGAEQEFSRTISESCRPTIEVTYADSWCAKFTKESSYSSEFLSQSSYAGALLTGKQGNLIGNAVITGYADTPEDQGAANVGKTASGNKPIVGRTVAMSKYAIKDLFGIDAPNGELYGLPDEQLPKIMLNGNVYVVEDTGGSHMNNAYLNEGKLWVDVFCNNNAESYAITNMDPVTPIYLAEDIKTGISNTDNEEDDNNVMKNQNISTVANILGKVTYNKVSSSETGGANKSLDLINGNIRTIKYTTTRTTTHTTTLSNTYNSGKATASGNEEKFINLYKKNEEMLRKRLKPTWLCRVLKQNAETEGMIDLTKYLIYKATYRNYGVKDFDFNIYDLSKFSSISSSGDISLTTSQFTKEVFIEALKSYSEEGASGNKEAFDRNFLPYAEEIYDYSVKYNINPELVVTFALKESGFGNSVSGDNKNYWGLDTPNGSSLGYIDSLETGIRKLADRYAAYSPGGSQEQTIIEQSAERKAADCNVNGYGDPGTLKAALMRYSDIIGSYNGGKHIYGNWSDGGTIYLEEIYGNEYDIKCGYHSDGTVGPGGHTANDLFTIQEHADYTAYLYEKQLEYWKAIFGKYGSVGGGGEFYNVAKQVWTEVCQRFTKYGGTSIPPSGTTIDCSSYVSWVLYEYGYTEFEGWQRTTGDFLGTNWNDLYGWEEISVGAGENPIDIMRPGDIFVRYNGDIHHMLIVAEISNGNLMAFDCGNTGNWTGKNGEPTEKNYFLTSNAPGKIIRPTPAP